MTEGHDGERTGLPASVEAAWGLRERPAKGPKPGLSLDRIVGAAVALAAAEGLGAVSMGRVAKELGVSTMSLYRYVGAKDELYILMQEAVMGPPPEPPAPGTDWREAITDWAVAQRVLFRRNLWVLRVPISGPPATPNSVAWWERGLAALEGTGLDDGDQISLLVLISGFVRNDSLLTADLAAAVESSGVSAEEVMRRYATTLKRLADPARYPSVARLLESRVLDEPDVPDYGFEFGLDRILDGVAVLIEKRRAGS
ncbi:TetR/AcrR family transcriptional regulator C-terminal domain-containing protein [Streptomyces sp. NPDC004609]|uniref:TetR/AcrR family transcriptional regulator C-terminal domain-containing protein n=1 Tax=Streptomyces sp. NPDC004609 TaxID=3364704 RepID=UPI003699D639